MSFIVHPPSLLTPSVNGKTLSAQAPCSAAESSEVEHQNFGHLSLQSHSRDPSETLSAPPYLTSSPYTQSSENSEQSSIWPGPDSSLYLTPPQGSSIGERPPYRSRSPSAESLNMVRRRASTMPHESEERTRLKSRRTRHHRKARWNEEVDMPLGWLPSGASKEGPKLFQPRRSSSFRKQRRIKRSILKHLKSQQAHPMQDTDTAITSRSNSVRSNDVFWDCNPAESTAESRRGTLQITKQHTHMPGVADQVIKIMRDRLTCCTINDYDRQSARSTPATITLRRASAIPKNDKSAPSNTVETISYKYPDSSIRYDERIGGRVAYVITDKDLDFLAELINSTFDDHDKHTVPRRTSLKRMPKSPDIGDLRRASVLDHRVIPSTSTGPTTATSSTNVACLPSKDVLTSATGQEISLDIDFDSAHHSLHKEAKGSVYEIIWKDDRKAPSSSESQGGCSPRSDDGTANVEVKGSYPKTTNDCQEDDFEEGHRGQPTFKMDWSNSGSPTQQSEGGRSSTQNPILSVSEQVPEVVSFPPLLERPSTNEWITPIANIMSLDDLLDQSLYAQGIDAHTGPKASYQATLGSPPIIEVDDCQDQSSNKVLKDEESPIGPTDSGNISEDTKKYKDRKVAVRSPVALHRTGESFQLGSAIGVSAGKRRKSSTRPLDVREEDEAAVRGRKRTWYKPRKDSGWPRRRVSSVQLDSPERRPSELSDRRPSGVRRISDVTSQDVNQARKSSIARFNLIERLVPRLPSMDRIGIYQSMTGTENPQDDEHALEGRKHGDGTILEDRHKPSVDWIG